MKLNHLNLAVSDVPGARGFLETYFGLRPLEGAPQNESISILLDDDGLLLTLMRAGQVSYPGSFHIGFTQPSEEHVNELNQRLRDDGYDPKPPRHFHGSWTFYFKAPGGFTVEVQHFLHQEPRVRPPLVRS